jgi:hypothetical protein
VVREETCGQPRADAISPFAEALVAAIRTQIIGRKQMMLARNIALSPITQRLQQWQGQSAGDESGETPINADSLAHAGAGRANLLATQEVAWAKLSTLPSPREIAWARCKTKLPA